MTLSLEVFQNLSFRTNAGVSAIEQPVVEPAIPDPLDPESLGITDPIYGGLFLPIDLDFETIPPPLPLKDDGKPDFSADASRMQNGNDDGYTNGYLRTLANYVLPISPSETHSDLAKILRALVRQKKPARIGVLSYEANVDINTTFSLILPTEEDGEQTPSILAEVLEINEDQEGEIYAHAPTLRKFVQESMKKVDIENVDYTEGEIEQVKSALRVLNLLEDKPADLPRTADVFSANQAEELANAAD